MHRIAFAVAIAALALSSPGALAQSEKAGVEKLYVLAERVPPVTSRGGRRA